jgi:hypothetical protein
MSVQTSNFKHVSYLWNDDDAAKLAGDEIALLIYRSNLLGADLRLTARQWQRIHSQEKKQK